EDGDRHARTLVDQGRDRAIPADGHQRAAWFRAVHDRLGHERRTLIGSPGDPRPQPLMMQGPDKARHSRPPSADPRILLGHAPHPRATFAFAWTVILRPPDHGADLEPRPSVIGHRSIAIRYQGQSATERGGTDPARWGGADWRDLLGAFKQLLVFGEGPNEVIAELGELIEQLGVLALELGYLVFGGGLALPQLLFPLPANADQALG